MSTTEIAIAIITALLGGGLFGFLVSVYRARFQNKVDDAHATNENAQAGKTLGEAWASLYSNLERRVNHLETVVAERDALIDDLTTWAEKLVRQLKDANIEPVPFVRRKHKGGGG